MTTEAQSPAPTCGAVLLHYADKQASVIASLADGVRTDEPDAVHRTRVACRRLRSALTVYGPLVDPAAAAALIDHLRWYGDAAGAPRDAEVLKAHLLEAIASLEDNIQGAVADRVRAHLDERHTVAHAHLVSVMAGARYVAFRRDLADFVDSPPLSPAGHRAPGVEMPPLLGAAVARVSNRYRRAMSSPESLERWHRVRKAAKAVRYCSEALTEVYGDEATSYAALFEAVTEGLGVVQDTVVAQETLGRLAAAAAARGEPTITYGVLQVTQTDRRRAALTEALMALDAALSAGRSWLR